MGSIKRAIQWLRYHWLGLIIAYLIILVGTYLGIWQFSEPIGIPENIDTLPNWIRNLMGYRIFFHLTLTVLIGSHITLVLDLFLRRDILQALNSSSDKKLKCEDYGIEILSPSNSQVIDARYDLTVQGTFKKKPPFGSTKVFVIDDNNEYYPQLGKVNFIGNQNRWKVRVNAQGLSGTPLTVMVAVMGANGQALCDYYEKIHREFEGAESLPITTLTRDIYECDRVTVVRRNNSSR